MIDRLFDWIYERTPAGRRERAKLLAILSAPFECRVCGAQIPSETCRELNDHLLAHLEAGDLEGR